MRTVIHQCHAFSFTAHNLKPRISRGLLIARSRSHTPVMAQEVTAALMCQDPPGKDLTFLDCTFGGGGHTKLLLNASSSVRVIGIDRDPEAIGRVQEDKVLRAAAQAGRLQLHTSPFSRLEAVLHSADVNTVDGVLFDLGVSSFQLEAAQRGFSFLEEHDGPLDMRMGPQEGRPLSAVLQDLDEAALCRILQDFGDEPCAPFIAQAITAARSGGGLTGTAQLARTVVEAVAAAPVRGKYRKGHHPATRTFQALRMHVNDEAGELRQALHSVAPRLRPGGRLAVLSFHSIEDRMVKRFIASRNSPGGLRRVKFGTKAFALPSSQEVNRNPRARSARLRVAEQVPPSQGC